MCETINIGHAYDEYMVFLAKSGMTLGVYHFCMMPKAKLYIVISHVP
jgi:hypothetical protein